MYLVYNMSSENKEYPWKNGYWIDRKESGSIAYINGENIDYFSHVYLEHPELKPDAENVGKLEYGDFGPAPPELVKLSGIQNFNLKLELKFFKVRLILNDKGTRFYAEKMVPTQKDFGMREWVNDEELNEFKELWEPADSPICKYAKLQPNKPGKIIWFSGPPGAGKSTSAQLMGRKHGYVYYEGDCYNSMSNPFIDLNVDNPSLAQSEQTPLKGISKERIKRRDLGREIEWHKPEEWDKDVVNEIMEGMCEGIASDVLKQRKRIGGDWSIAFAVFSRKQRDIIRKILGPDVIFVVLNLTKDCTKKRLAGRHGDGDTADKITNILLEMHKFYEKAGEDEENAFNIMIEEDMNTDNVIDKVMDQLKTPWKNGYWIDRKESGGIAYVNGENIEFFSHVYLDHPELKPEAKDLGKLEYGDFGPAPPELVKLSGVQNFNLRLELKFFKLRLIVNDEGTRFYAEKMVPTQKDFRMREWVNDEELNEFKELREPADAPICRYAKLKPNKPGKIIWFSGPPGAGKSTTAQLMGRKHGYIYYEGDCYNSMTNPFIDLNVDNPSLAQSDQIPLKGISKERVKRRELLSQFKFDKPEEWDKDEVNHVMEAVSEDIANDILKQRQRIGGDWSVAFAVFSRKQRHIIRKILGPDVIFIVLNLTKDCTKKRLAGRHGDGDLADKMTNTLLEMHKFYEKAGEHEWKAFNIMIEEDMNTDNVIDKVMDIIKPL